MGLFDLGKRLWDATREQGKLFWDEVGTEFDDLNPQWDKIKQEFRQHGGDLRYRVRAEMQDWLEQELRDQQINWRNLLGHDPEVESAYALLGLPYGTDIATVKQAWRSMLKESHPDLHMRDPDAHARATQQSQQLTAAYHQIVKAFEQGRI